MLFRPATPPQHYYGHTMQGVDDLALAAARFAQPHTSASTTATTTASSAATLTTAPTSDTIASSSAGDTAAAPPAPIRATAAAATAAAEVMRGRPALVPARTLAATSAAVAAAAEVPQVPGTGAAGGSGGVKQQRAAGGGPLAVWSTGRCGGGVVACAAEWMQQVRRPTCPCLLGTLVPPLCKRFGTMPMFGLTSWGSTNW